MGYGVATWASGAVAAKVAVHWASRGDGNGHWQVGRGEDGPMALEMEGSRDPSGLAGLTPGRRDPWAVVAAGRLRAAYCAECLTHSQESKRSAPPKASSWQLAEPLKLKPP
jgi:hypothetical protein